MKTKILILYLVFTWTQSFSNPDSLYNEIKYHKEQQAHYQLALTQLELAKHFYFTERNYDSTCLYTEKVVNYFTQHKNDKKLGYTYKLMGYAHNYIESYEKALQYFDSALVYLHPKEQRLSILQVHTNQGIAYNFVDNPAKAIDAFKKALDIAYALKDTSQIVINNLNTGIMYNVAGQISEAAEYLIKSIELAKQTQDTTNLIKSYIELGDIYVNQDKTDQAKTYYMQALDMLDTTSFSRTHVSLYDVLGYVNEQQKQFSKAEDWYQKAYNISKQINYKSGMAQLLYRMGILHKVKREWQSAKSDFNSALKIEKQIGSLYDQLVLKNELADIYIQIKSYERAEKSLNEVINQANENDLIRPLKQAHKLMYQYYKQTGAGTRALEHYEAYRQIDDSIYNVQQIEIVESLREQYETAEKEQTIIKLNTEKTLKEEQIKRQQQLLWSIIASAVFLVIILVLLYLQFKRKTALKRIQIQQQLFRAQLNPHFIFNALNAIKGYITAHKTDEAAEFLTDFSSLMRQTLESSIDEINSLATEIELLTAYLKLQQMRLEHEFKFLIDTASEIKTENTKFPAMLLQPFVENAVEHGIKNGGSKIEINFTEINNRLAITISDDGPGIENTKNTSTKKHHSRGMEIIKKRMQLLNKMAGWEIYYATEPLNNNQTGTVVKIDLALITLFD
ncbi:Sensor histidine kinase YpdA [Salinivirga cyanobacteriivorans]|uniref:Sensor histidine kinase YpdA n=1 Tax=Salinivirga cyanobacteriivorans TaxID=1307839 RepID=A0A0S2HV77_9BACT|nr:tetratricopeptide repeat protein [Salinivirga cyanobacteriivorans]ALO13952.1 Sensor histidine kinase YpdA [Salinivirga cyanobacteriivorans]